MRNIVRVVSDDRERQAGHRWRPRGTSPYSCLCPSRQCQAPPASYLRQVRSSITVLQVLSCVTVGRPQVVLRVPLFVELVHLFLRRQLNCLCDHFQFPLGSHILSSKVHLVYSVLSCVQAILIWLASACNS